MLVSAVERFAQVIPLNIQEIFLWYFEQKGVENPERFLAQGVNVVNSVNGANNTEITPPQPSPSGEEVLANSLQTQSEGNGATSFLPSESQVGEENRLNHENQQAQNNLPLDMNTLTLLLGLLQQVNKEKGDKAKPEDFIKVLENILAQENNNEVQEL